MLQAQSPKLRTWQVNRRRRRQTNVPRDLNCDGSVNVFDIDPFVLALTDPGGYAAMFPSCGRMLADCNCDDLVNAFDIDAFVSCLVSGNCPPCE